MTDEVMDHQILDGFKPVNIEAYNGTTDPAVWIEDFILHIHMARGDDIYAIKYLPLKLKGLARHWLKSPLKIPLEAGRNSRTLSGLIFKALMCDHQTPMT